MTNIIGKFREMHVYSNNNMHDFRTQNGITFDCLKVGVEINIIYTLY